VFLIIGPIAASLTSVYPDKATLEKSPARVRRAMLILQIESKISTPKKDKLP
jgi:hypothetical protein